MGYRTRCLICCGTGCVSNRSWELGRLLEAEVARRGLGSEVELADTGCQGFCAEGPVLVVEPGGILYRGVKDRDVASLLEEHLLKGRPVTRLLFAPPDREACVPALKDIPFFAKQRLRVLRNRGLMDPERIDDYIAAEGYLSLGRALTEMSPEDIIEEVKRSGLRGRGGGGFPTGIKWESCRKAARDLDLEPVVICNADEGDPGAFMDRSIIECDPHAVLEGMVIAARGIGAREGFVYVRQEYPLARARLLKATGAARDYGLLGRNILGSGFDFDVEIVQGAGAFVCGESTALMASLEGRVGEPRAKYVHTVEHGYQDRPSNLNNVETFANVPLIIRRGAKWFASLGTGDVSESAWGGSSGTKVFSLSGAVNHTGLIEVPMGITLREIIFDIAGGIPQGRRFKAVQTGGPSGGFLPGSCLDLPVDYDSLTGAGATMGSGGMVVADERTCMVEGARFFVEFLTDESCGKCTPCREGLRSLLEVLARITRGQGKQGDIELLEEIGAVMQDAALCALGTSAPNPVLSTLRHFRDEYESHIRDRVCPAGSCPDLIEYAIDPGKCDGCHDCVQACSVGALRGEARKLHRLDRTACIKCGACVEACTREAIRPVPRREAA